jgi:hypothetical protein
MESLWSKVNLTKTHCKSTLMWINFWSIANFECLLSIFCNLGLNRDDSKGNFLEIKMSWMVVLWSIFVIADVLLTRIWDHPLDLPSPYPFQWRTFLFSVNLSSFERNLIIYLFFSLEKKSSENCRWRFNLSRGVSISFLLLMCKRKAYFFSPVWARAVQTFFDLFFQRCRVWIIKIAKRY